MDHLNPLIIYLAKAAYSEVGLFSYTIPLETLLRAQIVEQLTKSHYTEDHGLNTLRQAGDRFNRQLPISGLQAV